MVLETVGSMVGTLFRSGLRFPPLRALDSAGGLAPGGRRPRARVGLRCHCAPASGPADAPARRPALGPAPPAQPIVPSDRLLHALARVDPFPSIAGPQIPAGPLDGPIAGDRAVRAATHSVVRVLGSACGLGISGSGWVAAPGVVVTAAHVVAGERSTSVVPPDTERPLAAEVIGFDPKNDVAVLRVRGLSAASLTLAGPEEKRPVGIVGYPLNGPLDVEPGRVGRTEKVLTDDAYGHGPVERSITSLAGVVRHGNSGGPAIDSDGRVQMTIFALRVGESGGYGIPAPVVKKVLDRAFAPVSTGACAP